MIEKLILLTLDLKSLFVVKPERITVPLKANDSFRLGTNIGSSL